MHSGEWVMESDKGDRGYRGDAIYRKDNNVSRDVNQVELTQIKMNLKKKNVYLEEMKLKRHNKNTLQKLGTVKKIKLKIFLEKRNW